MNWTLYISGLPEVICSQCLRRIYAPYGTVQAAQMVTDRSTLHRIGLGVVRLEFPAGVGTATAVLRQGRLAGYPIEAYFSDHNQLPLDASGEQQAKPLLS
jgi:hypothetical protein